MKNNTALDRSLVPMQVEIHFSRPLFDAMYHITKSQDADNFMRKVVNLKQIDVRESFWIILLTNANRVLGISEIGRGDSKGVIINIQYILQLSILSQATAIILIHNHCSGKLKPSDSDIHVTKKVKELTSLCNITLLDHIIMSSESYFSFADNMLL